MEGFRDFNIRASLIMCFLRHLSADAAHKTLEQAKPYLDKIVAVGLDSAELGNPPTKFESVFQEAAQLGLKLVAHAGEEGGPDYVQEALDFLHVRRVDHGVQCLKDPQLVKRLAQEGTPLTTCPLSNLKLEVNSRFFGGKNVTGELLTKGLKVTLNSDDPAYFGGYIVSNFLHVAAECDLSEAQVYQLCRNSFDASFLSACDKAHLLSELDRYTISFGIAAPPRAISMFGSRSPQYGDPDYEVAREVAHLFSSHGYSVFTGGYGGVMEACSRGGWEGRESRTESNKDSAVEVHGVLAPTIFTMRNGMGNQYLTQRSFTHSLVERVHRLFCDSEYFLVFGGTIGTITELFVVWCAASFRMIYGARPPKILVWRPKWEKILEELISGMGMSASDRELIQYVDSGEEALRLVEEDWKERKRMATVEIP